MIHIGMDLHHKMAYLRAITDDGELLPGRKLHFNNMSRFWEYFDSFGDEPCRVVFEAISNSRWMYRLLRQRASLEPVVVTPHKVKIIAETVAKTDKIDAAKLAWLSSVNMLPEAWMPSERIEELRELVRHRTKQVRQRTRAKNEVNAVLVRCGIQRHTWAALVRVAGPAGGDAIGGGRLAGDGRHGRQPDHKTRWLNSSIAAIG